MKWLVLNYSRQLSFWGFPLSGPKNVKYFQDLLIMGLAVFVRLANISY